MKKNLIFLFLLAVAIRLLYFPNNIYFAYDQARDSFTSLEILKGDFKVVGPPSAANDNLFAGPLIFYIYAPIYYFFDKNPEAVAIFLRIFNSFGVILTFLIASIIFNKRVGLISAFIFALSYEASQYSLFFSHQALAVITVLIFYFGLASLVFQKKQVGLIFTALGLGLSIQFHYVYVFLFLILIFLLIIFKGKNLPLKFRYIILAIITFGLTVSTYILSEIKFNFRITSALLSSDTESGLHPKEMLFTISRLVHDNLWANYALAPIISLILAITLIYFIFRKETKLKLIFLLAWFFGGLIPYLLSGSPSYYYSAGVAISLIIFYAFLINHFWERKRIVSVFLFALIMLNNLNQIFNLNKLGPNKDFIIQPGMLLSDEKRVIDYIYQTAGKEDFAIGALTIPLSINTTWSYIFEWYGKEKYGHLPLWVGPAAQGYPGNLQVVNERSKLPERQFLIIEPTVGIREQYKKDFFQEENYFTQTIEERNFGTIIVQQRKKI